MNSGRSDSEIVPDKRTPRRGARSRLQESEPRMSAIAGFPHIVTTIADPSARSALISVFTEYAAFRLRGNRPSDKVLADRG
jgi:hypothetical protein